MNASGEGAVYYDPYKVEITADPYPVFRRLREEAPLYYNPEYDFYAVSRFEDVERGLADRDTYISGRGAILELIKADIQVPRGVLILEDPPIHTVHRGLINRVFSPTKMNALEGKIREFCARSLDPLVGTEGFDFIADLGAQMPMRVIGMLLGIPEQDQDAVRERGDASLRTEAGKPMEYNQHNFRGEGFEEYIEWRSKHPSNDLMTELLNAEFTDETGTTRTLTRDEVVTFVNVLAGAGNETTTRLIGWTGKVLAEHPQQRREILQDRSLIPGVIEELLRFESPAPHVARYVNRDVEVHGQVVPKGSSMLFLVGSANRDDRRFAEGDRFDIHRQRRAHLTFGHGFHACVGAALARIEGRVALDEVLNRFPEWNVDYENARLSPTSTVRGWETLPVFLRGGRTSSRKTTKSSQATSVDGTWKITIQSPVGPQSTVLTLASEGGVLTGTQSGQGETQAISDGKVDGNALSWVNHVTKPIKMKVQFACVIEGNQMNGKAKAGFMGSFPFTGVKE
jgi:cytochrome P450